MVDYERRRKQVVNLPSVLARECQERRKACTEYLKNTSNAEMREMYKDKRRISRKTIRVICLKGAEGCQSNEVKESTWCLMHYG